MEKWVTDHPTPSSDIWIPSKQLAPRRQAQPGKDALVSPLCVLDGGGEGKTFGMRRV